MGATVLENWSEWMVQTRDLMKRSEIKAEVVGEARRDMEELMSSFCSVKKRRACPAGSPPAEIWTMLLHASRNLSPGGQGIGYQRKKIESVFTLSLVEKLLCRVRSSGTPSLAWHHSSGAPLHKSNKAGPKGKRVVHVLPSVGKQFFKVLPRTKRGMWSPPCARRLAAWIHPGKEARVGGPHQASHDMEAGTSWYEIVDGLSRPHQAMDRAAERLLGPNCLLGQQRYRLATTTIPGMDGDITLKIGEGGLMGDALFWVAFLPWTIRWQRAVAEEGAESGQLLEWHPWSGGRVDLSLSQYADDTTKQIVAESGEDVRALAKRVRCSNDVFDRALATDGFSQNRGKEELLMHLVGEGSFTDRRLVRDGKVSLPGKVVTVARHLGSHLGEKASFAHELPRRRQATMTAFYSVGQLWYESRVSWRLKRCFFFIGRVVNTALSGIEAFCPSKAQYQSLTSLVTCLARRVMAGAAARRGDHGRVRTMSNKEVLRFWKLAPCDVEARVRRLKWAQTLVQDPAHHTQSDLCHVWETGPWWRNIARGQSVGGEVDGRSGRIGAV